jgi:hypothetical protein
MWTTIATDGVAVGNLEFLGSLRTRSSNYKQSNAQISEICDDEDPRWERYDIRGEGGVASLNLRKLLRPVIHKILGIPESGRLEGTTVQAHYKDNRLVGFTPLTH